MTVNVQDHIFKWPRSGCHSCLAITQLPANPSRPKAKSERVAALAALALAARHAVAGRTTVAGGSYAREPGASGFASDTAELLHLGRDLEGVAVGTPP